jgi:HEAT repeat protein
MKTAVNDLVSMRDIESLAEIMNENEDWLDQMDAAEGLVQLGDRRGLDYLLIAKQSDIEEVRESAEEVLNDPEIKRMRAKIEAELRFASQKLVEAARERLKNGKKVYLHKVIQLSMADFLQDDSTENGIQLYEVNDAGLQGWQMVNVLPCRQLVAPGEESSGGAYVFLQKELTPEEAAELENK